MPAFSRRSFLSSPSLGGVFVVSLGGGCAVRPDDPPARGAEPPLRAEAGTTSGGAPAAGDTTRRLRLDVNGRAQVLKVDVRTTLLDALRDGLGLTGTK